VGSVHVQLAENGILDRRHQHSGDEWRRPCSAAANERTASILPAATIAMNHKHLSVRSIFLLAAVALHLGVSAQVRFDLAADFSAAENPNGAWSFGWMPPSNSVFYLYSTPGAAYGLGLNEWHGPFRSDNGASPPDVICNPTDAPITVSDTTWLPLRITFHPGEQGERSVIRWTAPFAGPASLAAAFEGRSGFATSGVEIYQSNTLLFSGAVLGTGPASQLSFATNLLLQTGDTIDFRVNYGNGDWASDTTQIAVVITPVAGPLLTILLMPPDSARLTWPTNHPGYQLETADQISNPLWSPVTNLPIVQAYHYTVTIGTSNQSQFFRLRRQ
jgi:hypothetical protein